MSQNRAANKALRSLLREIEKAGGTVTGGRRGRHWRVLVDDKLVATIAGTCSDRRAHFSVLADLRRAGLDIRVPR